MSFKLIKIDELSDGTQRFQSQLLIGTNVADFIMENDGIMKHYDKGDKGFGFYEYKGSYEIVNKLSDMIIQPLK